MHSSTHLWRNHTLKPGYTANITLEDLKAANAKASETFPIRKALAYLIQLKTLISTDEISRLPEGRGIVITPDLGPQPQTQGQMWLEEQCVLAITGEFNQPQGDISEAKKLLEGLIGKFEKILKQIDSQDEKYGSHLQTFTAMANEIKRARKELNFVFDNHNREKLDTYLRTLEFNLRHYAFLQQAGVYYLGRETDFQHQQVQEKLNKETLYRISSIADIPVRASGRLLELREKCSAHYKSVGLSSNRERVMGYVHYFQDGYRYIPKKNIRHYLEENVGTLQQASQLKKHEEKTAKEMLRKSIVQDQTEIFSSIDTLHKIWVNSAPSNNPCTHELLVLSRQGSVVGYAHINAFYDVLTYIPKEEFNDYLKRHNRTVMGMQKMHIRDMQQAQAKLIEYTEKKWFAAGFLHNCANFVDAVAHDGGQVPLAEINPRQIGRHSFFSPQYPLERLNGVNELKEMHIGRSGKQAAEKEKESDHADLRVSEKFRAHLQQHKNDYKREAEAAGFHSKEKKKYAQLRLSNGYSRQKAIYTLRPSVGNFLRLHFSMFFKQKIEVAQSELRQASSEGLEEGALRLS